MIVLTLSHLPDKIPHADMFELRADLMGEGALRAAVRAGKDVIFTCRRACDGGIFHGDEGERIRLLKRASETARYVDVELDVLESGALRDAAPEKIIASFHDTRAMPEDLEGILARLEAAPAAVVKLAATPHTHAESARLLGLYKKTKKPAVIIGMGETGFPTRVLGAGLGAAWTYACMESLPHMPLLSDLEDVFHYEDVGRKTRVFGVAGDPVSGSAGPLVFNHAFRAAGIDAVYLPFKTRDLAGLVRAYEPLGLAGLSVTHPLKKAALELARDSASDALLRLGAANTLSLTGGARRAAAFDGPAVSETLENAGGVSGKTVLILGAGGAARAAAFAIARPAGRLVVANRTHERAEKLAREISADAVPWEERVSVAADVVVNATTLGMYDNPDASPMPASYFPDACAASQPHGIVAMDMVYNPPETRFLKDAEAAGARVVPGREIFVRQARMQFETWFPQTRPLFPEWEIVENRLKNRRL